jgi:hypothetical protein
LERACVVNLLGSKPVRIKAVTENVGRGGALLRLEDPIPLEVGARVAVELILNAEASQRAWQRKCMYCRGVIRRVLLEDPDSPARIGVSFDYVDFRNLKDKNLNVLQAAVV